MEISGYILFAWGLMDNQAGLCLLGAILIWWGKD
jgi:hypothetical protein